MTQEPKTTDDKSRSFVSIALAVVSIGFCIVVESAFLLYGQRSNKMFQEFELEMSFVTRLATGQAVPLLLGGMILAVLIKEFLGLSRFAIDACNLMAFLIGLVFFAIFVVGIVSSWLSLTHNLSDG